MNKLIIILMFCFSSAHAVYTPVMPNDLRLTPEEAGGTANYMQAFREGAQGAADIYGPATAAENLRALQLQNRMLEMQWASYLAAHPEIAKKIHDKDELQTLINRNSGLFSSRSAYIIDLKNCANHGNRYCRNKLDEELVKCKKKRRC